MQSTCAACGTKFEAVRKTAKYCSDRCRKKAAKTRKSVNVVALRQSVEFSDSGSVADAIVLKFSKSVIDSAKGRLALALARRIDVPVFGESIASVARELRMILNDLEGLGGEAAVTPLDRIRSRRANG